MDVEVKNMEAQLARAAELVRYEIGMLNKTYHLLLEHSRERALTNSTEEIEEPTIDAEIMGDTADSGPERKPVHNAILESFLIHVRVLYDFLSKPNRKEKGRGKENNGEESDEIDDIVAVLYQRTWIPSRANKEMMIQIKRINRSVAHLSFSRLNDDYDEPWRITAIYNEIMSLWDKFIISLSPERKRYFVPENER